MNVAGPTSNPVGTPIAPLTYGSSGDGGPPAQRPPIEEDFPKPGAFNPLPKSVAQRSSSVSGDTHSTESEVIVDSEDNDSEGTKVVKQFVGGVGPPPVQFIDSSIGTDIEPNAIVQATRNNSSNGVQYRHSRHDSSASVSDSSKSKQFR